MLPWLALPALKRFAPLFIGLAAVLALVFGFRALMNAWDNHLADVRAQAVELRESQISAEALRTQLARAETDLADERARLATLTQQLNREREAAARRVMIFNRHRFGELVQAKPELIESRINKATIEVWTGIERESQL